MEKKMETTIMENQMEKKMETTRIENQMEKKMETTILENQMEKKTENEMETGIIMFSHPNPSQQYIYYMTTDGGICGG